MTLRGDTTQHPEPSIAPDDNHATLARILSVTPELVPTALANLIASEREAAVSEFRERAVERLEEVARTPRMWMAYPEAAAIVRDLANTT